jgi:hypothetical protein
MVETIPGMPEALRGRRSGCKHPWERLAVVTDNDWMRNAIAVFGWLSPGERRVLHPGELEQAKAWTGGGRG